MTLIRNEQLLTFFNGNNNRLLNKNNIELKLRLPGRIIAGYQLEVEQKEKYSIVLQSEYKVLRNFTVTHQIQSIEDLQQIAEPDLWQRYLSVKAEVVAVINETCRKLFFTVTKAGRTSVIGEENEFIESIPEVLSLPHQFEEYLINHPEPTSKRRRALNIN